MSYSGGIKIDESAARSDMSKIDQAIPELQQARAALVRVREEGEATKGQTGKAIVEKSTQLINRIDKLIQSLREVKQEIHVTVQQNRLADSEIAKAIGALLG